MQHEQFQAFLELHQLPREYLDQAFKSYKTVIDDILNRRLSKQPIVLGINGCQGSGKSTTAAFLQHAFETIHHLKVVNVSLDDFYLSKKARIEKSKIVHPLFATRGVPGTHDTKLAMDTLQEILMGKAPLISRFNKAVDDLFPRSEWDQAPEKADIIILEGWFLCARAQDESALLTPVNDLERNEDIDGIWRQHVNEQLKTLYQALFNLVDCLVMLKAPSFEAVFSWRLEQENKLAKKLLLSKQIKPNRIKTNTIKANETNTKETSATSSGLMNKDEIKRFINYFQRLTENILIEMPERADHCYYLNTERQIVHEQHRNANN
jgi:D-glycerate 3-kinase